MLEGVVALLRVRPLHLRRVLEGAHLRGGEVRWTLEELCVGGVVALIVALVVLLALTGNL